MTEMVRYTYPLRPGTLAERALLAEWRRRRFHWNEAVHQQESSNRPTFIKLPRVPNESHHPYARLRVGSQVAPQQTLRMYTQALDHSFKVQGHRRPTATSRRKSLPSLNCTVRGLSIGGGRLILPKNVSIPIVCSRELPSDPTSVRVMARGVRTASVQPFGRVLRTVTA
jgi:putative transposase